MAPGCMMHTTPAGQLLGHNKSRCLKLISHHITPHPPPPHRTAPHKVEQVSAPPLPDPASPSPCPLSSVTPNNLQLGGEGHSRQPSILL